MPRRRRIRPSRPCTPVRGAGRTCAGRVAARFEGAQLSYRELNARANQLAHHLRALGVGRDSLVGVWMERSVEMIVALLGVLKAGGAYVPLDPAFPKDRIDFMMDDAALGVVVTQTRLAETLGAGGPHPVRIDGDSAALANCRRQPGAVGRCAGSGLRHLHVGLDRPAQGRADRAPLGGELPAVDAARAGHRRARPLRRGDDAVVRHRGSRDSRPAHGGRHRRVGVARDGAGRRAPGGAARAQRCHDPAGHAGHVAPAARNRLARTAEAQDAVRRRSACHATWRRNCWHWGASCGTCTARPRPRSGRR